MFVREGVNFGGKELSIETGRMAKQADGSVVVRYGDTMVLVTAVASSSIRPGVDFMPLTVDYLEKTSAAGRIPGGYFKREGRMTEVEVLTSRLIDRPSRPLFPKGWRFDTQVIAMVVSTDRENASDVLAMTGASMALHLSDIPWAGPYAGVRVGRIDGKLVVNPTFARARDVGSRPARRLQPRRDRHGRGRRRRGRRGRDRRRADVRPPVGAAADRPAGEAAGRGRQAEARVRAARSRIRRSSTRSRALANQKIEARDGHPRQARALRGARCGRAPRPRRRSQSTFPDRGAEVGEAYESAKKKHLRELVLDTGRRIDGRAPDRHPRRSPARSACCRARTARRCSRAARRRRWSRPRSAPSQDAQHIEALTGDIDKRFMLHYNFPPFSTGETKPLRGASRREIGHGNLAERAIARVLPSEKDFPYTIRIVSEILESNGSSSMASVCGGILSLMDARRSDQDAGGRASRWA